MLKLIIDISEEDFDEAKILFIEGVSNNIEYAVAHGKPYKETASGDLISRKALKKAFEDTVCIEPMPYAFVKQIIDNAPTVPQDCSNCKRFDFPFCEIKFDKEQLQEIVDKAKAEVLASIERPQGEWIFFKANEEQTNGYECSVCKRTYHTRVPYFSEFNFCPNCGAQMVGGGENE